VPSQPISHPYTFLNCSQKHTMSTIDQPYNCNMPGCSRRYTSAESLKQHRDASHSNKSKRYSCNTKGCRQTFSQLQSLKQHESTHAQTNAGHPPENTPPPLLHPLPTSSTFNTDNRNAGFVAHNQYNILSGADMQQVLQSLGSR